VRTPKDSRQRAELRGELAALLRLGEAKKQKTRVMETRVSLVAGERSHLYRTNLLAPSRRGGAVKAAIQAV